MSAINYKASSSTVSDDLGNVHYITKPLVKRKPSTGGWKVWLTIKNQVIVADGFGPSSVFIEVCKILRINNVNFDVLSVWLHCNKQWMERSSSKYRIVSIEKLLSIAVPSLTEEKNFDPSWVKHYFKALQVYLSCSTYEVGTFIVLAETLRDCSNPDKSLYTGNPGLYKTMRNAVFRLSEDPPFRVDQARDWLYKVHSLVCSEILGENPTDRDRFYKSSHWK